MTDEQQPTSIIATVSGKDLLDRLDTLSTSFRDFTQKFDDIPRHVADLETRMRAREAIRAVTWSQLGAVVTVLSAAFGGMLTLVLVVRG